MEWRRTSMLLACIVYGQLFSCQEASQKIQQMCIRIYDLHNVAEDLRLVPCLFQRNSGGLYAVGIQLMKEKSSRLLLDERASLLFERVADHWDDPQYTCAQAQVIYDTLQCCGMYLQQPLAVDSQYVGIVFAIERMSLTHVLILEAMFINSAYMLHNQKFSQSGADAIMYLQKVQIAITKRKTVERIEKSVYR